MRTVLQRIRNLWCMASGRCTSQPWELDELKADDPQFSSHMEWMAGKQQDSRQRREHFFERDLIDRLERRGGPHA